MTKSRDELMGELLGLLQTLAGDWEYTDEITPRTRFITDMGLGSLDLVMLATAVQERYETRLPFVEFFSEIGRREVPDLPVEEWVDFVHKHLDGGGERQQESQK
jgi:acyl carrier protein